MNQTLGSRHKENIDHDEITKFESIAESWWDLNGKCKLLHRMNPLRLNYIMHHANGLFCKKVLDIGCGGGILSESMAHEGAQVVGIDMAEKILQIARWHSLAIGVNVTYMQDTAENHAKFNTHQYDVITCMEMLEHVPNPASIVFACIRLVKSGGHVFFSTINRNFKSWLLAIIGTEYILNILPKGTHEYKKFIRPSELIGLVDSTLLQGKHIIGLHYNPLTDHIKLSSNVDVNYIVHMQYQDELS